MAFNNEPTGYRKTIISDLQGAWQNLRDEVVNQWPFPECQRLLFHIDEGLSWESVRDLDKMRGALVLIRNIAAQAQVPAEISEWLQIVWDDLDKAIIRASTSVQRMLSGFTRAGAWGIYKFNSPCHSAIVSRLMPK